MNRASDLLKDALASDVRHIYKQGFHPMIGAASIPALAELAEVLSPTRNDGKADYYRQIVEALLRRAIDCLPVEVCAGTADLLGVNEPEKQRIGARRDIAAEHLGFESGDSLRQSKRAGHKVIDLLLEGVVDQLLILASGAEFAYTARFTLSIPSQGNPLLELDSSQLEAAQPLSRALLREVQDLFTKGFDRMQEEGRMPTLDKLADMAITGAGSTAEKAEVLLLRTIAEIEDDPMRREGIVELVGLGRLRSLELRQRRNRAAPHLGYYDSTHLNRNPEEADVMVAVKTSLFARAIGNGIESAATSDGCGL
jgi:hypothetical protein